MKVFRLIKKYLSRFIVDYISYELNEQNLKEIIVYLDGDSKCRYYKGSCTVWYNSNIIGVPLKRCNIITEERLYGVWKQMKDNHVWKIKVEH